MLPPFLSIIVFLSCVLLYPGYPIINDPLYNHPAWRDSKESHDSTVDHVISEIVKTDYSGELYAKRVDLSPKEETSKEKCTEKTDVFATSAETKDTSPVTLNSSQDKLEDGSGVEKLSSLCMTTDKLNSGNSSLVEGTEAEHNIPVSKDSRTKGCPDSDTTEKNDVDPDCTECQLVRPDPTPSQLVMYLHALSYEVW